MRSIYINTIILYCIIGMFENDQNKDVFHYET